MKPLFARAGFVALASLLAACATPQIPSRLLPKSEPQAAAVLRAVQRAHGAAAFAAVRDVSVHYDGQWAPIGPRFQPVLADRSFRRTSEERWLVGPRIMAQEHTGPVGKKVVRRAAKSVEVAYNGAVSKEAEVNQAAALVADAYTLFLLGPFYFQRPGVTLAMAGEGRVDGQTCDRVLAVLRPGFGFAEEDRVLLFVDRVTRQLRRVRMTLNGLESTRAAEVDVTFREFRSVDGVLWATDFDERIRVPFDLHAHHWRLLGLETNRGFGVSDLSARGFGGRAARPTGALPR